MKGGCPDAPAEATIDVRMAQGDQNLALCHPPIFEGAFEASEPFGPLCGQYFVHGMFQYDSTARKESTASNFKGSDIVARTRAALQASPFGLPNPRPELKSLRWIIVGPLSEIASLETT